MTALKFTGPQKALLIGQGEEGASRWTFPRFAAVT